MQPQLPHIVGPETINEAREEVKGHLVRMREIARAGDASAHEEADDTLFRLVLTLAGTLPEDIKMLVHDIAFIYDERIERKFG